MPNVKCIGVLYSNVNTLSNEELNSWKCPSCDQDNVSNSILDISQNQCLLETAFEISVSLDEEMSKSLSLENEELKQVTLIKT